MGNRDDEYDYLFKGEVCREKFCSHDLFFVHHFSLILRFSLLLPHSVRFDKAFVAVRCRVLSNVSKSQRTPIHTSARHHSSERAQLKETEKKVVRRASANTKRTRREWRLRRMMKKTDFFSNKQQKYLWYSTLANEKNFPVIFFLRLLCRVTRKKFINHHQVVVQADSEKKKYSRTCYGIAEW